MGFDDNEKLNNGPNDGDSDFLENEVSESFDDDNASFDDGVLSDDVTDEVIGDDGEEEKKKKKKVLPIIIIIIAAVILVCAAVYIGYYLYNAYITETAYDEVTTLETTTAVSLASNPIDFDSLTEQNDEIYAWITIEDTNVDYPIVQSDGNDEFYLKHSALDRSWLASGAIYTEGCNKKDFSDPITVIYGHNGYSDTMFTTLHYFEDEEFFDEHPYFYIYLDGRKLTYQVISAFKYDNRHIMNSFNFYDADDLADFQDDILNPSSTLKNVREDLDVEIDENSKIVVLSTCITNQKSNRYLVCGVLVNDEETD